MDEPTRGVDVGAKFEIYQLIRQLNKDGIAILMISSELPEILGLSDRILVMREGKIVAELTPNETTEEMIIEFATTNTQSVSYTHPRAYETSLPLVCCLLLVKNNI